MARHGKNATASLAHIIIAPNIRHGHLLFTSPETLSNQ